MDLWFRHGSVRFNARKQFTLHDDFRRVCAILPLHFVFYYLIFLAKCLTKNRVSCFRSQNISSLEFVSGCFSAAAAAVPTSCFTSNHQRAKIYLFFNKQGNTVFVSVLSFFSVLVFFVFATLIHTHNTPFFSSSNVFFPSLYCRLNWAVKKRTQNSEMNDDDNNNRENGLHCQ